MTNFKTRYGENTLHTSGFRFKKPSMTNPAFKNECDINKTLKKFQKDPNLWSELINQSREIGSQGFADLTNIGDFQNAMNKIAKITEFFQSIPSEVRAKYDQDPAKLFKAMNNPSEWQYLTEKGVLNRMSVQKAQSQILNKGKIIRKNPAGVARKAQNPQPSKN